LFFNHLYVTKEPVKQGVNQGWQIKKIKQNEKIKSKEQQSMTLNSLLLIPPAVSLTF